jgi:hypothetical protein
MGMSAAMNDARGMMLEDFKPLFTPRPSFILHHFIYG